MSFAIGYIVGYTLTPLLLLIGSWIGNYRAERQKRRTILLIPNAEGKLMALPRGWSYHPVSMDRR